MANIVQTSNISQTSGPALTLNPGDGFTQPWGFTITDTDPSAPAIFDAGQADLYLGKAMGPSAPNSQVSGALGVRIGAAGATSNVVVDFASVIAFPTAGPSAALSVSGGHSISVYGTVSAQVSGSLGQASAGILTDGAGNISNSGGTISGYTAIRNTDTTSGDHVNLANTGTITALGGNAYDGSGSLATEWIDNRFGTFNGNIVFGDGAGDIFSTNCTPGTGAIIFGNGAGDSVVNAGSGAASHIAAIVFGDGNGCSAQNQYGSDSIGSITFGNGSGDQLINRGTISTSVTFGSGANDKIYNTSDGLILCDVTLGNGSNFLFDSTNGAMSGTVFCGSGGDAVMAGLTGGTVIGGLGNDRLYANPTSLAAANGSRTTLDGGGGSNALYGGTGYTTFIAGDTNGGFDQIWGGASAMAGVSGYTNNTLSYATVAAGKSVYVDLLGGHNGYLNSGANNDGAYTFEDSIANMPNVVGSGGGDILIADNGKDRVTGGGGGDSLYAGGGGFGTFVYTDYADSNLVTGYDTVMGFKLGTDKIDLSALHTSASHLVISTAGTSNSVYVEQNPGTFNASTDLAMVVNTTTPGGLQASNFVF
jgi:hypothetical protein